MGKRTRRRYSEELKAEAVNLVEQHGYGVAEAARRLDIDRSVLARWLRDPQGKPAPARAEVVDVLSRRGRYADLLVVRCTAPPTTSRPQPITRKPLC